MSEIIVYPLPSGANYVIPDIGNENWGQNVTDFLVAIPNGTVPTSGNFALTGDVTFTGGFGLVSPYFKTSTINPASAGFVRLAKTESIDWRNNANSANLPLTINGSDQLTFNGSILISSAVGNLTDVGTDGIVVTGGTGAVLGSGTSLAQHVADASHNGYLSSTDWSTFNSKGNGTVSSVAMTVPTFLSVSGSPITSSGTLAVSLSGTALPIANGGTGVTSLGNLTDVGTDGITITSGTGAVIHDASISQHVADSTHNGYLSSTDWSTFNSAAGGGITSLTGDVTGTGPGATVTTLATVNSNVGSFTNANITVNAKGLITAAANGSAGAVTVNTGTLNRLAWYSNSNVIDSSAFLINNGTGAMSIPGLLTLGTPGLAISSAVNNSLIVSASIATSNRTWTLPDLATNPTFAALEGTQTFSGVKTFSAQDVHSAGISISGSTASAAISASAAVAGNNYQILLNNSSTAADSAAALIAQTSASATGNADPFTAYLINGGASWSVGADNSDSDKFKITTSTSPSAGTTALSIDSASAAVAIHGSTTNDSGAAGYVGEYVEAVVTNGAYGGATTVYFDMTSISLTAGDWDVSASFTATFNGATFTSLNDRIFIGTTAGNNTTGLVKGNNAAWFDVGAQLLAFNDLSVSLVIPSYRMSLNTTTTVYMKTFISVFTAGTPVAACRISARRVR